MVDVTLALLSISLILFFGVIAEFIFKKTGIPDIIFLILLGVLIGPMGIKYIQPAQIESLAPVFTTFTLLFLLYEGAFNINLSSFARGITKASEITIVCFLTSAALIAGVMFIFGYGIYTCLLTGFILGGISSAFVIPVIKKLGLKGELYTMLTIESAMTDVLCIVFSLTLVELIKLNTFDFQSMLSKIVSLFAVAGLIGIIAGIIWIVVSTHLLKEYKSYMITIAYVILVYVLAEFLKGNGAIATLFLGLVLRNSSQLTRIFGEITTRRSAKTAKEVKNGGEQQLPQGIRVTSEQEEFFYTQISFFLKTFFFVYIGVMISFSNTKYLLMAIAISLMIMLSRMVVRLITKSFDREDVLIIESIFARGLAAAAIAQLLLINNVENAAMISELTYMVICFTIILSSIRVFFVRKIHSEHIVSQSQGQ